MVFSLITPRQIPYMTLHVISNSLFTERVGLAVTLWTHIWEELGSILALLTELLGFPKSLQVNASGQNPFEFSFRFFCLQSTFYSLGTEQHR
jgi:hypothetical protein